MYKPGYTTPISFANFDAITFSSHMFKASTNAFHELPCDAQWTTSACSLSCTRGSPSSIALITLVDICRLLARSFHLCGGNLCCWSMYTTVSGNRGKLQSTTTIHNMYTCTLYRPLHKNLKLCQCHTLQ